MGTRLGGSKGGEYESSMFLKMFLKKSNGAFAFVSISYKGRVFFKLLLTIR